MAKVVKTPLEQYTHTDKERLNNPPVGLVTPETDVDGGKKKYQYDPHLDPQLQWAGKAERTSFEVPVVSLHVHERIDPKTIIGSIRNGKHLQQPSLFETDHSPLREAIEFYKHKNNWSNRLIAGDSLLVMNSLLEKEGMAGKIQMVYFDPPYGIKYGSNFQPFINKRDVKDGKDEDLTAEPEMIKAFRDTWELGIHSYLSYLRDRLLLAKELLSDTGSIFVQISDENVHHVRELMDEVFGSQNFCAIINFAKTSGLQSKLLYGICDYILWYSLNQNTVKYHQLYFDKVAGEVGAAKYSKIELLDGTRRPLTEEERQNFQLIPKGAKYWVDDNLTSQGNPLLEYRIGEKVYQGTYKTTKKGLDNLQKANRIYEANGTIRFVRYIDDFPCVPLNNTWTDIGGIQSRVDSKIYVVQTANKAIQRCLVMTTDPGDLVLDITCGSGTTAYVAEQWGRRWITCDTSRVALTLAKQRLMTSVFDYYELARQGEGIASGFKYKTIPHITLKSIANNEPPAQETLYDQPLIDSKRMRVTGPFTVEAVPAPLAKSFEEIENENGASDNTVARTGETLRIEEWRSELARTGIKGKGGQKIEFTRVELLPATKFVHAEAETNEENPKRVLISFGPEFAPLEQRQVERALEEAGHLKPKADMLVFAAFEFDAEASKDIDETVWPGMTILKAQMNADLFTEDLKKNRKNIDESFWLIGQPDVLVHKIESGEHKGKVKIEVVGFDYYNTKTGKVESGGRNNIAMWMLDTDYDGRSLFASQVFLPMAGDKEGWSKLGKNLKAEIDAERLEMFRGNESIPFEPGEQIAVKIVDDRGIESLKIIRF